MKTPFFTTESHAVVILSGWRANQSLDANYDNTLRIRSDLDSLGYQHHDCVGAYLEDGQHEIKQEVSHIIDVDSDERIDDLLIMAQANKQDCIMVLKDDKACLYFPNKTEGPLGTLVEVTEDEAKYHGFYTYWRTRYFVCK